MIDATASEESFSFVDIGNLSPSSSSEILTVVVKLKIAPWRLDLTQPTYGANMVRVEFGASYPASAISSVDVTSSTRGWLGSLALAPVTFKSGSSQ